MAFKEVRTPETVAYLNVLVNIEFGVARPGAGRIELGLDGLGGIPALDFRVDQAPLPPGFMPA
jgi:hypothetical protein